MKIDHSSGHRALRRGRWSQAGHMYLLTAVTQGRSRVFDSPVAAHAACRAFQAFDGCGASTLFAWVLMPDHAHWLLRLGEGDSLAKAVNHLKSTSARNVNRISANGEHPVWARGFHDRALRRDSGLIRAARYVVLNPVRAGLVDKIGQYPYWNCCFL